MNITVYYTLINNNYGLTFRKFDDNICGIYQPLFNSLLKHRFLYDLEYDKEEHNKFKILVEKLNE